MVDDDKVLLLHENSNRILIDKIKENLLHVENKTFVDFR